MPISWQFIRWGKRVTRSRSSRLCAKRSGQSSRLHIQCSCPPARSDDGLLQRSEKTSVHRQAPVRALRQVSFKSMKHAACCAAVTHLDRPARDIHARRLPARRNERTEKVRLTDGRAARCLRTQAKPTTVMRSAPGSVRWRQPANDLRMLPRTRQEQNFRVRAADDLEMRKSPSAKPA